MKTTATKLSLLAFLGLGLVAYGQSGKVGVNTSSPRATLDVQPSATNSQDNSKTNEGILAPKLSKTRVASIEAPVEGTLVYVIDDANKTNGTINAYTGADPKVAKITEKGYYYYNGTEWVKSTAGSLDQEWVYEPTDNRVVLKRSYQDDFNRLTYYTKNGYKSLAKNLNTIEGYDFNSNSTMSVNVDGIVTSNLELLKSSDLSSKIDNNRHYSFSSFSRHLEVDGLQGNDGANSNIFLSSNTVSIPSTYQLGVRLVRTGNFNAQKLNSGNTTELSALVGRSVDAGGGITNAIIGNTGTALIQKPSGSVNFLYGTYSRVDILSGNASNITNAFGVRSNLKILGSGNITNLYGYSPTFESNSSFTGTITNYYDFYGADVPNSINITNRYGVFIPGSNKVNYFAGSVGIGTAEKPVALLDVVAGGRGTYIGIGSGVSPYGMYLGHNAYKSSYNTNFTSVASELETQKGSSVFFTDANNGTVVFANFVKASGNVAEDFNMYNESFITALANKNVGIGTNSPTEKLEVAGNVKATGFIGANAAIFPDYVFQKYYTGTSSLKADYSFKTLSQVEDFVKTNGHLPGYQSAEAIKKQGYIDLMATQLTNVEKIEELYLHLLEKDKEVKALKAEITELKSLVKDLLAK
ncbi:hypothetical protein D1000_07545 [Riemerella anatipestifer]|uniref:hypothetical protein n=1 Tax=Riemerella anatipestifer TaxID=34085 RepID=UPI00129E1D4E|nr:hypothetical protein [Riemerella anatipestifer]MDR7694772.1 hypothetical protein [Riemerella anatipestifer]MDR7794891.1 hypothetical protein [Riemerella anatipestifer]MRN16668.1 hypothetical protein [Riemerella anatipestifer]